ncbi:MAG: histidinol-phosphate transaminase [Saprospiraceae bacterium]
MTKKIDRRSWLRSTALMTSSFALTPGLKAFAVHEKGAAPNFKAWDWERSVAAPDITKLKARLLANENPYGPSDKVRLAIMESAGMGNRYGHTAAAKLIDMIAEKEGVTPEHIMLGPGSTDMLEKTAITHFIHGGNIVSADPAYMSLIKTAMSFNAEWKNVPLTKDWAHDLPAMEAAIDKETKLVYVCNPNNPTGSLTPAKDLWNFCERVSEKAPIFVDEAYLEFLDNSDDSSMVGLVKKGKNVIVARTFSKIHSMAGLRVGYIVGTPETLEKISSMVRGNMGMSITSLKGAMASMEDVTFQENSRKWTTETREYVFEELGKMGFDYIPSYTSFILFPIAMSGAPFLEKMFDKGVGVRAFEVFGKQYCRVSMGKMKEMELFIDTLKQVLV